MPRRQSHQRDVRPSMSKLTSTGSPAAESAEDFSDAEEETRDRLYQRAAALGINGRSRMTKRALQDAIARREREGTTAS
jgi:hypothetical protein